MFMHEIVNYVDVCVCDLLLAVHSILSKAFCERIGVDL